jgi:hypothetical protein
MRANLGTNGHSLLTVRGFNGEALAERSHAGRRLTYPSSFRLMICRGNHMNHVYTQLAFPRNKSTSDRKSFILTRTLGTSRGE